MKTTTAETYLDIFERRRRQREQVHNHVQHLHARALTTGHYVVLGIATVLLIGGLLH